MLIFRRHDYDTHADFFEFTSTDAETEADLKKMRKINFLYKC